MFGMPTASAATSNRLRRWRANQTDLAGVGRELRAGLRGVPNRGAGLIQEAARERDQAVDIGEVAGQADRYAYRAGAFVVADALDQRGEL